MIAPAIMHIPCRIMRIVVLLFIFIAPKNTYTWDLAVASKQGLQLLTQSGNVELSSLQEGNITDLYAVAFDPAQDRFFLGVRHANFNVFSYSLNDSSLVPIVPHGDYFVEGLAYDVSTQILYWTDGKGHNILKRSISNLNDTQHLVLHLPDQVLLGIAVSYCHRALFWTNANHSSPSINRAEMDGSNHMEIVLEDISYPSGVTVDEAYGKVYWADVGPGIYYRIERCSLDGSDRELVLQRTQQQPIGLALIGETLLWSDKINRKVWSLSIDMTFPNHTRARLEPDMFFDPSPPQIPLGLAGVRNASNSCKPVKVLRAPEPEDVPFIDQVAEFCLNSGDLVDHRCKCKRGFSGKRCEVPVCLNHCLHSGTCFLDSHGFPDCKCQPGYEGRRCERDVCDEYCLFGGRCYVESGQPSCSCPPGVGGQRCEANLITVAATAASTYDVPIIAGLGAVSIALLVVVLILMWRVVVLRRRPRVKRRYIVNKTRRSQTPLTSRPAVPAVEQCEITIENCCNMNICETPCFEPNLRTSSSSSSKKGDDRLQLIKNMEEGNSE